MTEPVELHTERLVLRAFRIDDVAGALAYRNDEEFARFLSHISLPFTELDAEAFVRGNMAELWDVSPTFAVVFGGELIGTVNLEVNIEARTAMLGYAISRAWWGVGIATEAARAVMAWGIETFRLRRIWASTDVRNIRSQRVMEKLAMKREAVHDGHHLGRNGEWIDEVVYAREISASTISS